MAWRARHPAGLIERIRAGVRGKLTVVAAPAGFGKTTLLAEWLTHGKADEPPVAWVSLDRADNEPALFWTYIVRALQKVHPDLGQHPLAILQTEASNPLRAAVSRYRPDGSGGEVIARGLRNAAGLAVEPTTGAMWASQNERDNAGDDIPSEEINILTDGTDFGWPYCYGARIPNRE